MVTRAGKEHGNQNRTGTYLLEQVREHGHWIVDTGLASIYSIPSWMEPEQTLSCADTQAINEKTRWVYITDLEDPIRNSCLETEFRLGKC